MTLKAGPATYLLFLVLLAVFISAPLLLDDYLMKVATRVAVLAIFAMSLDLLVGYTGLVSFGHAAFFGFAAYMLQILSPEYEAANLLWVLPLALVGTAAVAAVIGSLVVRTRGIYFIMVTLAFAQMLFFAFHDSKIAGGSDGAFIYVKPSLALGSLVLLDFENPLTFYYSCVALLTLVFLLLTRLLASPFGQAIQGIKVNEHRMAALGYNTYLYKLVSFIFAGTLAGLAGFLFACIDGFVAPQLFSWQTSGMVLIQVILGGMGTLAGPVLGVIAYVGAEEIFKDRHLVGFLAEHWLILMGSFVIAVVLLLPKGIAGGLLAAGRKRAEVSGGG